MFLSAFLAASSVPPASGQGVLSSETGPVEAFKIRFPDYNPDGTLKSEIFGDRAVMDGNIINLTNLRVELYEKEVMVTSFWAESCRYDKKTGSLETDSPVRVMRSGMMITGEGLDWKKGDAVVIIRRNVRVMTIMGTEWFKVEKRK
jgi:hypothetical protein